MMFKRHLKTIALFISACLLTFFYYWTRQHSPESLLQALQLDAPTRFVLVMDAAAPQFASYDVLNPQAVPQIVRLRARPEIARLHQGELWYGERGGQALYRLALQGQREEKIRLEHGLEALYLGEDEALIQQKGQLTRWHRQTGQAQHQNIETVSAHRHAEGWLLLNQHGIFLWREAGLEALHKADWAEVSASAYNEHQQRLLFSYRDDTGWHATFWDEHSGTLTHHALPQRPQRPYSSQSGKRFYWLSAQHLWLWDGAWHSWDLDFEAQNFVLAQLDKRLLLWGEALWQWRDAKNPSASLQAEENAGAVWDSFLSADSQTVFLGQGKRLWLLGTKQGQAIDLQALQQPHRILMGASYTLCH